MKMVEKVDASRLSNLPAPGLLELQAAKIKCGTTFA